MAARPLVLPWFVPAPARSSSRGLQWPAAAMLMVTVLLAPALWNGFPLIFADTGGYLARPFERTLTDGRSALYGTFLATGIPFDFWPIVLLQSLVTIWVVLLVLRTHLREISPALGVAVVVTLSVLTSLPWYTGQLMPDIFVPLAVLALEILAFGGTELTLTETTGLAGVVAFAIASHMAILALSLSLLISFAVVVALPRRWQWPRSRLALPIAAVVAGMALALTSNAAIGGKFAFTPGGINFLFGRLVQDNIVSRYLDEHCPDPTLRLCPLMAQVPATADDWLWWGGSPLNTLGEWSDFEPEARHIVLDTLRLYPAENLTAAIKDTIEQLVTLQTGEGINPDNNWHANWMMSVLAPNTMPRFHAAAQQQDRFRFGTINSVQVPLALLATGLLPLIAFGLRRRRPRVAALALTAFVALVANAAICGIFSNPNARYQSRLVPIAVLAVAIAAIDHARRPQTSAAEPT